METFDDLIKDINSIVKRKRFIYEEFYTLINGIGGIPIYNYTIPKGQLFYRSRINPESDNYYQFKDLIYPEKKFVTSFGRTNRPGQSLLYLSDTIETSFSEVLPEILNKTIELTTTHWRVEENIKVSIIPDFDNIKMKELIAEVAKDNVQNQMDFLKLINFYFRAVSVNGDYNYAYEITSSFSNARLAESKRSNFVTEGTLFTSVQRNKGFNLSLYPETVIKDKIQIIDVTMHHINKLRNNLTYDVVNPLHIDFTKGVIKWKKC